MGIHSSIIDRFTLPKCMYFLFFWINIVIDNLRGSRPLLFVGYSWIRLALTEKKFKLEYVITSPSHHFKWSLEVTTERSILLVYMTCVILGPMLVFTKNFMGKCSHLEFCWWISCAWFILFSASQPALENVSSRFKWPLIIP